MENFDIFKMKINDTFWHSGINKSIIRVPGGWIYEDYDLEKDQRILGSVFVPEVKPEIINKESSDESINKITCETPGCNEPATVHLCVHHFVTTVESSKIKAVGLLKKGLSLIGGWREVIAELDDVPTKSDVLTKGMIASLDQMDEWKKSLIKYLK